MTEIKVNGYSSREDNSVKIICFPSKNESALNGKTLGANSFLLPYTPFQKGLCAQESKQYVTKVKQ